MQCAAVLVDELPERRCEAADHDGSAGAGGEEVCEVEGRDEGGVERVGVERLLAGLLAVLPSSVPSECGCVDGV